MEVKPWLHGPVEVFVHGIEHYFLSSDRDIRFALIHCDNAAELAMKSYIRFHNPQIYRRIHKDWREISRNFAKLVEVTQKNASSFPEKLSAKLFYHHTIRNDLYHEALTLPRKIDVSDYIESACRLFKILFGDDFDLALKTNTYNSCILAFIDLEFLFQKVCKKKRVKNDGKRSISQVVDSLVRKDAISEEIGYRLVELIRSREQIILDMDKTITDEELYDILIAVNETINELQKI